MRKGAYSDPGFRVRFEHAEPRRERGSLRPSAGGPIVLVVEEDHDLRAAMRDELAEEGFEVVEVRSFESGAEVLAALDRPCVVVIDHPRTAAARDACQPLLEAAEGRAPLVWVASSPPRERLADPRVPLLLMPFGAEEFAEAVETAMLCLGGRPH